MKKNKIILTLVVLFSIIAYVLFSFFEQNISSRNIIHPISQENLTKHVYILASDSLEGRATISENYKKAANYVANEFNEIGLKKITLSQSNIKTYLQPVLFRKKDSNKVKISISNNDIETIFLENIDFKFNFFCRSEFPEAIKNPVFIGFGIEETLFNWNDLQDLNLKEKGVIMYFGAPLKNDKAILNDSLTDYYSTGKSLQKRIVNLKNKGVKSVVIIVNDKILNHWDSFLHIPYLDDLIYKNENATEKMNFELDSYFGNQIFMKPKAAENFFTENNIQIIENNITHNYKPQILEDIEIIYNKNYNYSNPLESYNIVGFIEGKDKKLKSEFILISAHLDHLPVENDEIFNGADDNASGVAGLIEIARALKRSRLKRSVILLVTTGEELGLFGMRSFYENPCISIENIMANINLDMIGRSTKENLITKAHYVEYDSLLSSNLKNKLDSINKLSINWPLIYGPGSLADYTVSEYYGIPSISFFSGFHEDFHKPTDDPEKLDFEKMKNLSHLVYNLCVELSNKGL